MRHHCSKTNGGVELGKLHRQITETGKAGSGKAGSGKAFMSPEKSKQSPRVGTEQGVQFLIQERQKQLS